MPQQAKHSWTYHLLLIATGVVLALSIAGSWFTYIQISSYLQNDLIRRVDSIRTLIEPEQISSLTATAADLTSPEYQTLKREMRALVKDNPDTRFAYITGAKNGQVFFFVDSEDPSSEDYSPPGEQYPEATEYFKQVNMVGKSGLEFASDHWGEWMSAFSPIRDRNGELIGVLGMDVSEKQYDGVLFAFTSLPLLAGLVIATILFAAWRISTREEKLTRLKTELLSIAAHDIRNPLIGIKWTTSQLLMTPNLDTTMMKTLRRMGAACDALLVSIENILSAVSNSVREQTLGKSNVTIDHILQDSVQALFLSAEERNVHIAFAPSGENLRVRGNPDVVRRIFMNLLSNAIKYSNKGSAVSVRAAGEGGYVTVTIKDAGIGIPAEDLSKVTGGFFRSANARTHATTGTGLGLYYCKRTIEEMGGSMSIVSHLGEGTNVIVRLPLTRE